jgi:CubicO group peptidase (beta-lactamase class C family)
MTTLAQAIAFAQAHEVPWPRDPLADPSHWGVHHADPVPFNRLRGPVYERGPVSGVVLQRGAEIAAWGEPDRADLTFSVAKTYLALLAGVAHDRGLLPDVDEPVIERVPGIGFESAHNRAVTWAQLLQQTSEWEGSCFGVPDTVDRYRHVSHEPRPPAGRKGDARPLQAPGTYWEYNDVRINQLSLALLHLFGAPLPQVFRDTILRPIGAGDGFRWDGYDDSWVDLPAPSGNGAQRVQSVPGGTHWGGGVSISARDQARIGQLLLQRGRQGGEQILSEAWVERLSEPCRIAPFYGMLTWLNRGGHAFPGAVEDSVFMVGAGGHLVWVDPARDVVVVARWLDPTFTTEFVALLARVLGPKR